MEKTSVSSEIVHVSVRKDMIFTLEDGTELCRKRGRTDQEETFEKDQEKEQVDHKNLVVRISFGGVVRSVRPVSSNVYEILNSRFALEHRYGIMTTRLQMYTALVAVIFYFVGGLGITAGYHRLLSHRSTKLIGFSSTCCW